MDDSSKEKLRLNHELIVNSVDLTRSTVLDHLIQDGILSSNEEEEIRILRTKREQNTCLLSFLRRRGDQYQPLQRFIESLRHDYGFVADKVEETYVKTENLTQNVNCLRCSLLLNLEPRDVSHFLYQEGAIRSVDNLSEINSYHKSRSARVKQLLEVLVQSSNENNVIGLLSRSLEKKYGYILIDDQVKIRHFVNCLCQSPRDINNASKERLRLKAPRKKLCSPLKPTTNIDADKGESSLTDGIFRGVTPSSPNDIKLLRKCSTLWNHLFAMRERGDWTSVDRLTSQARAKYADCPDIQVLLYRSQMCISIFYKNDHDQALEAF
ncbi:hypothetical protein FSP39_020451 [Pinctada imbricata]|uniref:CARD domain-containing protein n=1 Tax=Pinctada imbricata TaxID=66713 RepID=A0AA88Y4W6_PINIB|nr:hypothetical protein FSP39_020451 [Pinctada imbricata]